MLYPIPGSSIEPGYVVTAPVKFGARLRTQNIGIAKASVEVRAERQAPARASVNVKQTTLSSSRRGMTIGTQVVTPVKGSAVIRGGESFMILADLYPAIMSVDPTDAGYYPTQFIRPRLTVGGVEIPIIEFTFERPSGRLGSILNATVAQFDTDGLDPLMSVDFGYLIYNPVTETEHYQPRMVGGKLMGREHGIGWAEHGQNRGPNDTVSISAIDVIGDRFTLRPRRNVIMFDPLKVKPSEVKSDSEGSLQDINGVIIQPAIEEIVGLTAYMALDRAYTGHSGSFNLHPLLPQTPQRLALIGTAGSGIGFDRVITNIPDYDISRADFTIEGGWHEGALPLFAMYGPLFFDISNILFIINITYPLPSGFTPRLVKNSDYQRLTLITPVKDYTNSVVLTYKGDAAQIAAEEAAHLYYLTKPVTDEPQSQGTFGEPGYTRTETVRQVRELHHVTDDLIDTIVSSVDLEVKVSTYTNFVAGDGGAGALTLTHRETTKSFYNADLKSGHNKTVETLITTGPDASFELVKVLDETCNIEWEQADDPDLMIQLRSVTRIEGMIITSQDTKSQLGTDGIKHDVRIRYPVLVAENNGVMNDDVDTGFGPIREITANLRRTKGNQLDVEIKDFNLLTGIINWSYTQPTTGSRATSRYLAQMRHILIEDAESIALIGPRKPAGVNAGELPRNRAIQLAYDVLNYLKNPRYDANLTIAGIDFTLDRGSVIVPRKRTTDAHHFITTGTSEKGQRKRDGFEIIMTLQGQQVNS